MLRLSLCLVLKNDTIDRRSAIESPDFKATKFVQMQYTPAFVILYRLVRAYAFGDASVSCHFACLRYGSCNSSTFVF